MASQETQPSKRERQKQRRDAKLAEQRRQLARARRNRFIVLGLVAVVALAALGVVIQSRLAQQREREANIAAANARLTELGCTEIAEQEDLGGGHLTSAEQLTSSPPEVIYPDRPASSGLHVGAVAVSGVYDKQIDERLLVHNLEHGYVNVYYDEDADPAQVDALRAFAQEQIDGDRPEMIVAPFAEPLQGDANFAFTAWNFRQLCGQFDEGVLTAFLDQHYNGEPAPERFAGPHTGSQSGEIDPNAEEGPLLFPPLADTSEVPTEEVPSAAPSDTGGG